MHRKSILTFLILSTCSLWHGLVCNRVSLAQFPNPIIRPWQVQSFYNDASLTEKTITFADVAADGSIWLAVSDGLYHFDGYRWERFTTEHGLPSNYVRCVEVTSDGTMWVGTDNGAGTFDGETFDASLTTGNLAGPSIRRIVEDPDGAIWFCCDKWPVGDVPSGLTRMKEGQFKTWRTRDGLPSNYISDFIVDSQGRRFVLTNKGLAEMVSETSFRQPLKEAGLWEQDTYVWSLVESETHGLLASTKDYFFRLRDKNWERIPNSVLGLDQPKLVASRDGEIYTCLTGRGPYLYRWDGQGFVVASRRLVDISGSVDVLFEDAQGAIWIGGFEKLLRWERDVSEWQVFGDIGAPLIKDSQGGVWFRAIEDGLIRFSQGRWQEYNQLSTPIRQSPDGSLWMTTATGLARWNNGQIASIDMGELSLNSFHGIDGRGIIWITASDTSGTPVVAAWDGSDWTIHRLSTFGEQDQVVRAVASPDHGLWGVLGTNRFAPFRLIHFKQDGVDETQLPQRAQVSDPPKVFPLKSGELLIYGYFGLMSSSRDDSSSWQAVETPSPVVGKLIYLGDEIWGTSQGKLGGQAALFRFRDDQWTTFPDQRGQYVGRDGENRLFFSSQGTIDIVSADVNPTAAGIRTTPFETRVSKVVAAANEDAGGTAGDLWIGVSNRAYRYRPDDSPPETEIVGGNEKLSEGEDLVLKVAGLERFKPQSLRRNFLVSYRIDEQDWQPYQTLGDSLRIGSLPLGEHKIEVRVQDASRQIDPTPAIFRAKVLPIPLQSRAWFRPAVVSCFATIIGLGGLALFNWRRVDRMARSLEKEVDRKTERLQSSEREYRLLFEDSQDAICLFDPQGSLQTCNATAREILGLEDLPTYSLSELFSDPAEEHRFRQELESTQHLRGSRYRLRRLTGETIDAILSVNCRTNQSGEAIGYQVIIRDISTLVELQKRLSDHSKMEAIGRMAGGIAHDFNNFLAVVMYGADFVRLKAKGDSGIEEGVQMIVDAAERGRSLTSQIQTFSRPATIDFEAINTFETLTNLPGLLQGVLTPGVKLNLKIEDGIHNIHADSHQLEQILVNLSINACHAMPDGGTLTIQARNVAPELAPDDPESSEWSVGPSASSSESSVLIEVSDTGEGMDDETREKIFDPFFTTKPHGQGTGLGLAIVYGIVKQFGGQISVESELGAGTTFSILLASTQTEPGSESLASDTSLLINGCESLLIVEDETAIRHLVQNSLSRLGYRVQAVSNVRKAQQIIDSGTHFDLVISDVVMPEVTGIELVKWLRDRYPQLPCLLITGFADANASREIQEIATPFLRKPFHPNVLATRVRELLDHSQSGKESNRHGEDRAEISGPTGYTR